MNKLRDKINLAIKTNSYYALNMETLEIIKQERMESGIPETALALDWAELAEDTGCDEDAVNKYLVKALYSTR